MKDKSLYRLSYLYLLLPIICFYLSYLKIYISIPLVILIGIIIYKIFKEYDNKEIVISKKNLIILFIFTIILCITAGLGGLFYQSPDYHYRNAIFRDMITKSFPIYYNNYNVYLDYYFGFWIIPALIGKLGLFISNEVAFNIGNIGLLIWASFGVVLTFLWLIKNFKLKNNKMIIKFILVFLLFSGLDIIGIFVSRRFELLFKGLHIEWWASYYQFSSIITTLFWVFNQTITSWLITSMFYNEDKVHNFMLLILLSLPYAPLPFCGFVILFFAKGLYLLIKSIKESNFKEFIKDVFSINNILAFISILPIYYLLYTSNNASSSTGSFLITEFLTFNGIINELIFYLLEIGIYYILLFKYYRKDYLFHVVFISLIFIPYFRIGTAYDFAMRASIPLIVLVVYYILLFFKNNYNSKHIKNIIIKNILIVLLAIGSVTPLIEYLRAAKAIIKNHKINVVADDIKSLELNPLEKNINFVTKGDNSIFFKYLVR